MDDADALLIDIVIPNWNGRKMLKACLDSLQAQTFRNFTVTLIDNGSDDDSVAFINRHYPSVRIIGNTENMGFSVAVNQGIRKTSAPWVLLLNNDVEVDRVCLQNLAERCEANHDFDIFALKMLAFDQRTVIDGAGDGVMRAGVGYRLGTLERQKDYYSLRREVFGACAGAALYRRTLFDRIGYFDEDFFAYLEDVDFNMRAVRAGSRCCYLPDAIVYHIGSATSGSKINYFTVKLSTRNNIFVVLKNYPFVIALRFFPALLVYQFFWLAFVLKHGQFTAFAAGLLQSVPKIPRMMRKRKEISCKAVLSQREFAERVIKSEKMVIGSIMSRRTQDGKNNFMLAIYLRLFT